MIGGAANVALYVIKHSDGAGLKSAKKVGRDIMKRFIATALTAAVFSAGSALAQQTPAPQAPQPFAVGPPLGVTTDGKTTPISSNVKVFGSVVSAESCVYDANRKLIMTINRGAGQKEVPNDAWVSLHNSDGSVNTPRWIGATRNGGLVLNQPFGSAVQNGKLYIADSDGDTADGAKRVSVVRMFDMTTGAPAGQHVTPDSPWLNGLAVAKDGTIYGSQTVAVDGGKEKIFKITADGKSSVFLEGAPLSRPNGVAIDNDGNIVVVNMGDTAVMTFSPAGKLLKTEQSAQAGSDGIVVLADGTKIVNSVTLGGVSVIKPGKPAELVATGIPGAASACYDTGAKQLVIPMNANNALGFLKVQ